LGKTATSVINQRLLSWASSNDVITDAQFGSMPGYSITDAIFAFHSLISTSLSNKKKNCTFIDFKKAFDFVDRRKL
jgi:hypothetical protein